MKFLILFAFAWPSVFGLPADEIKSRNIVVPAGRPEGRMTNAFNARPGQFPYQVGVIKYFANDTMSWCGGTLISHTDVITAAHCTEDADKVEVILGATNRDIPEVIHEIPVEDIVMHPGWDTVTLENDIAVIHIPYTRYSTNIQPATLPDRSSIDSTFAGEVAIASGWGRTSDAVRGPTTHLQYAYFGVISNSVCSQIFKIYPSNICIATYNRISPCLGDSGGPLVLEANKTLIGVMASVSSRGCEKNRPAVFTRVTSYLNWIQRNSDVYI